MDSYYVGSDVAKTSFVGTARWRAGESLCGEFANTPAGFELWRARVRAAVEEQLTPGVVVLEPTGGFELALAGFAAAQGRQVSRPNALRVHDWANSLARFGAAQPLAAWKPQPRLQRAREHVAAPG